ncbi:MAG: hypothetical protein WC848_02905 [Parcubacteria group bacterium]|jgi:hypothetical protein
MYETIKKNFWPLCAAGVGIYTFAALRNRVGFVVLLIAVVCVFVMKRFDKTIDTEAQKKQQAADREKAEVARTASLRKLREVTFQTTDELSTTLRSILAIGETLSNYDKAANETVAEILKVYKVYVDKYLDSAATLAEKYRRVKAYLKSQDPTTIRAEVKALKNRMNDGEKNLERTLKEMSATLGRLEEMQKDQPEFRQSLDEIFATIQSLESSIKRAENDPDADTEIRAEIQRTISSTSEAIETTLVKAKRAI